MHSSRRIHRLNTLVLAVLIVGTVTGCASVESATSSPTDRSQSPSAVTAIVTKQPDIEMPAVLSEEEWARTQKPLGDASAVIAEQYESEFAYSFFTPDGFVIAFDSSAPEPALDILNRTGLPFQLAEDAGFNQTEYEAQASTLAHQYSSYAGRGYQVRSTPRPDIAPGVVLITFGSAEGGLPAGLAKPDADSPFSAVFDDSTEVFELGTARD